MWMFSSAISAIFFFSSRGRNTKSYSVTVVQACALPISRSYDIEAGIWDSVVGQATGYGAGGIFGIDIVGTGSTNIVNNSGYIYAGIDWSDVYGGAGGIFGINLGGCSADEKTVNNTLDAYGYGGSIEAGLFGSDVYDGDVMGIYGVNIDSAVQINTVNNLGSIYAGVEETTISGYGAYGIYGVRVSDYGVTNTVNNHVLTDDDGNRIPWSGLIVAAFEDSRATGDVMGLFGVTIGEIEGPWSGPPSDRKSVV